MHRHAADTEISSPAFELDRPRCGDRVLHTAVSEYLQRELGRLSRTQIAERRHGAVHQSRYAASERAAERDLALRVARHRVAAQSRNLQDPARGRAAAAL